MAAGLGFSLIDVYYCPARGIAGMAPNEVKTGWLLSRTNRL